MIDSIFNSISLLNRILSSDLFKIVFSLPILLMVFLRITSYVKDLSKNQLKMAIDKAKKEGDFDLSNIYESTIEDLENANPIMVFRYLNQYKAIANQVKADRLEEQKISEKYK
jgi:hypothetical protein